MVKKYPEVERYADSESVVDIDQAFVEFATLSRTMTVKKYLGTENVNIISSVMNKYKWENYFSNFAPYIIAAFSILSFIVVVFCGIVLFYPIFVVVIIVALFLVVSI